MKILITEPKNFSTNAITELKKGGFDVTSLQCDYDGLKSVIEDYEGIIIRLGVKIDQDMIEKANGLKFIATLTTGLDHIDLKEAKKRNIKIISLKGERVFLEKITPTAELAVGLMLSVLRNIVSASRSVQDGCWDRDRWVGRTMQGKTVGIIGMGRLGMITARLVKAFGCDVIYYDPFVFEKVGKRVSNLNELAEKADIVTIHVPLNEKTEGMIGKKFFSKSKEEQVVINTSRGAIIDEVAMCEALEKGQVAGAGVDVLINEIEGGINRSELLKYGKKHQNLVITPHIGGATVEAMRTVEEFIAKKIMKTCKKDIEAVVSVK